MSSTPIGGGAARVPTDPAASATTATTPRAADAGASLVSPELGADATLGALARGEGPSLGRGSRGPQVRLVQQALIKLGISVGPTGADGSLGNNTMAGVRRFQQANGLTATGVVDAATLLAIDAKLVGTAGAGRVARRDADLAVGAAAKDGKIQQNELAQAEADITRKYGAETAKKVLIEALGVNLDKLDLAAVDYLNGKFGKIDGHIGRYQGLLTEHIAGAKLLDTNFDGKLDATDKIFTKDASGKINVQNVGEALRDRLRIGKAMVDSCEAMDKAGHSFALLKDHACNTDFFKKEGSTFVLKSGKKASEAVEDIFKNPSKYKFECATAMIIVYYKAMLDMLGPKDFDRICGDLRIGPWDYENDLGRIMNTTGSGQAEAPSGHKDKVKPGDYAYIRNWDVSDKGRAAGWQGENVIYLGNGKYYGHPFGVETGTHIVDYLNTQRNAGSTRSASLTGLHGTLSREILKEDKDPNA